MGAAAQMAGVVRRRRSPGATPGRRGALPRRRQQDLKADPWTRSHADPAGSSQTGRAVCARVCGLRDRVAAPATLVRYDNTEVESGPQHQVTVPSQTATMAHRHQTHNAAAAKAMSLGRQGKGEKTRCPARTVVEVRRSRSTRCLRGSLTRGKTWPWRCEDRVSS